MKLLRVILDTNIIVAAIRSKSGASYQLLEQLVTGTYAIAISATLVFEYEEVLVRDLVPGFLSIGDVDQVIRMICSVGDKFDPARLGPSQLDPDDAFLTDLAVAARVDYLVTYNVKHLIDAKAHGIEVITPGQFLKRLRGQS